MLLQSRLYAVGSDNDVDFDALAVRELQSRGGGGWTIPVQNDGENELRPPEVLRRGRSTSQPDACRANAVRA